MLKFISDFCPWGVYVNGKGTSGPGLSAAVLRDQDTNEVYLEAGALVMADMGLCCIDEFDKVNESDRVTLHEVMEQ